MVSERNRGRRALLGTLALPAGAAALLFGTFWLVDFYATAGATSATRGPWSRLLDFDPDTVQNGVANLAQIVAAILGIAITVVSIVVQLAATRYTSRVADMFFRDRTNLAVMGFFVVACIDAVWVSMAVSRQVIPLATVVTTIVLVTASLLALIPYFAYVFDFLDPERVIARIGQQTLRGALGRVNASRAAAAGDVADRQARTATSMEQLADVAVNAISKKDKVIACDAMAALRRVLVEYLPQKARLPAAWFAIGPALRSNPDLVALAPGSLDDLAGGRAWLEWKGLRQMRGVFDEGLTVMPQMAHVVAIETRYVGEAALAAADGAVLTLSVKFMNTYLRAALNARDVGTAYGVLHQYRQLAEAMIRAHDPAVAAQLGEVADYFRYYAQLANGMGLGFITETAAYDLGALCEMASEQASPVHDRLLDTFLEIDKEAENPAQEKALRGVRKAQAKLAAYYLLVGATDRAREIFGDMASESVDRLRSIRDEMLSIKSKDFWEIIDRGANFDYVDEPRKVKLAEFFGWFPELTAAAAVPRLHARAGRDSGPSGRPR